MIEKFSSSPLIMVKSSATQELFNPGGTEAVVVQSLQGDSSSVELMSGDFPGEVTVEGGLSGGGE